MIDQEKVKKAVRLLLEGIGEDADREGLIETPDRIARMCEEIYGGYEEDAKEHLCKTFHVENSDMVVEKDITFYSMCEHHLLPFYGKAHIAYIPDGKVAGLSKLARTVGVCKKASASRTAYGSDRRCADERTEGERRGGCDRGRTYVYDDERNKKTGQQDGDICKKRAV